MEVEMNFISVRNCCDYVQNCSFIFMDGKLWNKLSIRCIRFFNFFFITDIIYFLNVLTDLLSYSHCRNIIKRLLSSMLS